MYGAILGDIIGSRFELDPIKDKDFELFTDDNKITDDTILSLAILKAIKESKNDFNLLSVLAKKYMLDFGLKYKDAGYGFHFEMWLDSEEPKPYNSFGNGSAMRVSACGLTYNNLNDALKCADVVTNITHNHPESIKAVRVLTKSIFMAKNGFDKEDIYKVVSESYSLNKSLDEIRNSYNFNTNVTYTMPAAFQCFFEGKDFIDVIRNAVSLGGDSDTLSAISASLAGAYYGIDSYYKMIAESYIYNDDLLKILNL